MASQSAERRDDPPEGEAATEVELSRGADSRSVTGDCRGSGPDRVVVLYGCPSVSGAVVVLVLPGACGNRGVARGAGGGGHRAAERAGGSTQLMAAVATVVACCGYYQASVSPDIPLLDKARCAWLD